MKEFNLEDQINFDENNNINNDNIINDDNIINNEEKDSKKAKHTEEDIYKDWDEMHSYNYDEEEPNFYQLAEDALEKNAEYKKALDDEVRKRTANYAQEYTLKTRKLRIEYDQRKAFLDEYEKLQKQKDDPEAAKELKKFDPNEVEYARDFTDRFLKAERDAANRLTEAKKEAREKAVEDLKDEFFDKIFNEIKDKYDKERQERIDYLNYIEEYDEKKWRKFIKAKKKEGADVKRYNKEQRQIFNDDLKAAINSVKEKSFDDALKLKHIRMTGAQTPFPYALNDKDKRDAEQVFDKMFMELNAFYCKHNTGGSILDNFIYTGNHEPEWDSENSAVKNKSIIEYTKHYIDTEGIENVRDSSTLTNEEIERYAKMIILHMIANEGHGASFKFVPKYFENIDNPELVSAENQEELVFDSENVVNKENRKIIDKAYEKRNYNVEEDEDEKTGKENEFVGYNRSKFSEMEQLFPKYEVIKLAPLPVKEEPKPQPEVKPSGKPEEKQEVPKEAKEEKQEEIPQDNKSEASSEESEIISREELKARNKKDDFEVRVDKYLNENPESLNITAIEEYCRGLSSLAENYPELKELKDKMDNELTIASAIKGPKVPSLTNEWLPNGCYLESTNDQELKRQFVKARLLAKDLSNAISRCIRKDEGPAKDINEDIYSIIEEHFHYMNTGIYEDILRMDPSYHLSYNQMFTTFPYNQFKQKNGAYIKDDETYKEMMDSIPFVKQMKERQEFFSKYTEVRNSRHNGNITDEEIRNYRKEYQTQLNNLRTNFQTIKDVPADNPYVTRAKAFVGSSGTTFGLNWQGDRFANFVMKDIDIQQLALDRGWPVEDIGLIVEMHHMEEDLQRVIRGANFITPEQQQRARQLYESMKEPLDRVKNSIITSVEMRDDILDAIKPSIDAYVQFREPVKVDRNTQAIIHGTPAIKDIFEIARVRDVKPSELEFKEHRLNFSQHYEPSLPFSNDLIRKNIDMMMKDLNGVEMVIKGSNEFKDMKISLQELQTFAREQLGVLGQSIDGSDPYADNLDDFRDKLLDTTQKTKKYLARKQKQFDDEGNRREDGGRQVREQPRIKMAINLLDKLNFFVSMLDDFETYKHNGKRFNYANSGVNADKVAARERLAPKVQAANNIMKSRRTSKKDYLLNMGRVIIYGMQAEDRYYKMEEDEKHVDFVARIRNTGVNQITAKDVEDMMKKDPVFREVMQNEKTALEDHNHERLDAVAAYNLYATKYNQAHPNDLRHVDERSEKQKKADKVGDYKENLVSNVQKRNRTMKNNTKRARREQIENAREHHL